jgi:hypothetical protein
MLGREVKYKRLMKRTRGAEGGNDGISTEAGEVGTRSNSRQTAHHAFFDFFFDAFSTLATDSSPGTPPSL